MNRKVDDIFCLKINQFLRLISFCNKKSFRHTISITQVYLPSSPWLLLPFLNLVKASDVDNDYEDTTGIQRQKRALLFILAYTTITLSFVLCIYLRKKICRKRIEAAAAAAAAQHEAYSITIAARKLDIRVIDTFPQIVYPQTDAKFSFTDCHICLEEFKQGESLVMLPACGHAYHKDCIHCWMATRNSCCPDCRHDYGSVSDHV